MFMAMELSNQRAKRMADRFEVLLLSGWGQLLCGFLLVFGFAFCSSAVAQHITPAVPPTPQPQLPRDTLGRTTPRGTVLGFLNAARRDNDEVAAQYLNTRLRGKPASNLAHQLFVVLDRRLPAKLDELSDKPEDPLQPNMDRVGNINSSNGSVDILLERVDLGKAGYCWLFSGQTLELIPELYKEVNEVSGDNVLPEFLLNTRLDGIPFFEWVAILLGLPFLYLLAVMYRLAVDPHPDPRSNNSQCP
jgi:hypothetical protein